jgi:hypothetical protein
MTATTEDRKEACKTYIEQTKLLVTLASAFVLAPPALFALVRNEKSLPLIGRSELLWLFSAEAGFILSVLMGYVVLGSITGSQHNGTYDVYRSATMVLSWLQLLLYLAGLILFAVLVMHAFGPPH